MGTGPDMAHAGSMANLAHTNSVRDLPAPPCYERDDCHPSARMAVLMFLSNIAKVGGNKSDDADIDSGASNNFFLRHSCFISYEAI